ncbi:MAG: ATP-binding protein [Cyclobacteriaceae bacterium]
MRISYLIFLGFLVILIMFSITTFINYKQAEKVSENSDWSAKSTTIMREGNRFQRNILNMVSGLRGFLLSGETYFIQSYDSAAQENVQILNQLDEIISDTSVQKKALIQLRSINDEWMRNFAEPLISAKKTASISDSSLLSYNALYREKLIIGTEQIINRNLQRRFREFANYEYQLRDARRKTLMASVSETRIISFYLTSLSILIGFLISLFLAYRISTRILVMVKMANAVASGNYEVSTAENGRDELSQLARSLNHMASVLSENISMLQRKNEELDQFAHIVSHDLKAPLRGIDNVITWIEEDHNTELSPKIAEYIQLIKGRLVRAENMIKGILLYARVGRESLEKEPLDLNVLLQDIRENLDLRPGLKLEVQENLPTIYTERISLQQILSNLISNAIKYHNKEAGYIKVYLKNASHHYEFFVEDNGPGIAKNYHQKIFAIFQTLQERDSFESTGVGLAIVKKILDDKKQEITLTSEAGKGSVFSFTWPK